MTKLPDKIEVQTENNEGYYRDKTAPELVTELVQNYNQLIEYMEANRP